MYKYIFVIVFLIKIYNYETVEGHGRLIQPPSRSTAWRYNFGTPKNYNDHELYCGGFSRQWSTNKGKCGPCGDAWDLPRPRPNEAGGKYGTGLIVDKWRKGQVVTIGVEITANHQGYFEFRLCPHNNKKKPVTNACLDKNVLQRADGSGPKFFPGPLGTGKMYTKYKLPDDITCEQCVFQWRYVAGNNWGRCDDGTEGVGCGPQEQFRACADVSIFEDDGTADNTPSKYPDYVNYDDLDTSTEEEDVSYNEIDIDNKPIYSIPIVESNHTGHIVALTFAFLLTLLVLLGLVVYFYWAQDAFKDFIRKQKLRWINTEAPSIPIPAGKLAHVNPIAFPIKVVTPPVPPRRSKNNPAIPPPPQRLIRTISPPTNVSINGIRVCPANQVQEQSLHTPDD